jgi:peptidoglycan biosynthesis protein MviN/MurJ (putative lipid II flippase)
LLIRLLVTGIGSGPGYLLMGGGEFKTLARFGLRELALAIVLGFILGLKLGATGIALGFLLATIGGTFSSLFYAYAKSTHQQGGQLMWQSWWRGALGCAISGAIALLFSPLASSAWRAVAIGGIAAAIALLSGAVTGGLRMGARNAREGVLGPVPAGSEPPKEAQDRVQMELP